MSVLASLLRHPRFDYLRVDDLGPFFVDLRNTIDTTRERIR